MKQSEKGAAGPDRSPKQSALAAGERARTLAAAGDVDAACKIAVLVHTVGRNDGSERVRQAVRDFRASLHQVPLRVTEQLDHELHGSYSKSK